MLGDAQRRQDPIAERCRILIALVRVLHEDIGDDGRDLLVDKITTRADVELAHQLHRLVNLLDGETRGERDLWQAILQQIIKMVFDQPAHVDKTRIVVGLCLEPRHLEEDALAPVTGTDSGRIHPLVDLSQCLLKKLRRQLNARYVAVLIQNRLEVGPEQTIIVDVADQQAPRSVQPLVDLVE